jgi:hypothetical protein
MAVFGLSRSPLFLNQNLSGCSIYHRLRSEVLSYNLLAPAFVRPIDLRTGAVQSYAAFEWVSEDGDSGVPPFDTVLVDQHD